MSSIILVNDLFEELREENERLKQTIDLMVKYRKCLIGFRDNCNCDANDCNKLLVQLLEEKWTQLEDKDRNQGSQHLPVTSRPSNSGQTHVIDFQSSIGHHLTVDKINVGHRSDEHIVLIDDSSSGEDNDTEDGMQKIGDNEWIPTVDNNSSDEDSDVSPLERNANKSDGEDVAGGMEEVTPTADTSMAISNHRSTTQLIDSVGKCMPRLRCSHSGCDLTFVHHLTLNKHLKIHNQLDQYSCSLFPNTSKSPEQLESHNNSSHSVPISGQRLSAIDENRELNRCRLPDGRGYRCTDCRRVFVSVQGFTNHMRTHRGDYRFGCNECHKRFVDSSRLNRHKMYSHNKSDTNVFECQYTDCHYKTVNRSHFNRHQLNHENKRLFKCPFNGCNYRNNTNDNLREHKVNRHGFYRCKRIGR